MAIPRAASVYGPGNEEFFHFLRERKHLPKVWRLRASLLKAPIAKCKEPMVPPIFIFQITNGDFKQ